MRNKAPRSPTNYLNMCNSWFWLHCYCRTRSDKTATTKNDTRKFHTRNFWWNCVAVRVAERRKTECSCIMAVMRVRVRVRLWMSVGNIRWCLMWLKWVTWKTKSTMAKVMLIQHFVLFSMKRARSFSANWVVRVNNCIVLQIIILRCTLCTGTGVFVHDVIVIFSFPGMEVIKKGLRVACGAMRRIAKRMLDPARMRRFHWGTSPTKASTTTLCMSSNAVHSFVYITPPSPARRRWTKNGRPTDVTKNDEKVIKTSTATSTPSPASIPAKQMHGNEVSVLSLSY